MKKTIKLIMLGILLGASPIFSQTEYSEIDKRSKTVPSSYRSIGKITEYLVKDLDSDKEKARAFYIWISHNIRYNVALLRSNRLYTSSEEMVDEVFKKRKGVCQHYSELFHQMCKIAGVKSYVIKGYIRKENGSIPDLSHAWNAVKIDKDFYLLDVTWAAGYLIGNQYIHKFRDNFFFIEPEEFLKRHMPFDPCWQFISNPLSNNDFYKKDFSKTETEGNFAFRDTIKRYENADKVIRLTASNRRIKRGGINNRLISYCIKENSTKIENIKFNKAVDFLNYGVKYYNQYVSYKNRQFRKPKISDSKIEELINKASTGFTSARDILSGLKSENRELNLMIKDTQRKLPKLISDTEKEKKFVERYLKKPKYLRRSMFYKMR